MMQDETDTRPKSEVDVMDLLCRAYATLSDEDEENEANDLPISSPSSSSSSTRKRSSSSQDYHSQHHHYESNKNQSSSYLTKSSTNVAVEGRYVSKRERTILSFSSSSRVSDSPPPPTSTLSPVVGTIDDSGLPYDILASLRCRTTGQANQLAGRGSIPLNGHTNAVISVQWSRTHAHLLASAGMDQTVHVWNVWSNDQKKACIFRYHNAAIKDVRWSPQGLSLLSCGYDCTSRLVDVEKGVETQLFKEDQVVETIRFHPVDSNLFLSGGSKGVFRIWDMRCSKVVHEYAKDLGPVLDMEFSADGRQFISSTDTSRSNISENSIIVWDVSREVPLSNQVYGEAYTCPCLRYHPSDASFIAQSNANYIAIFSARPPFKLDRYKRYEGHGVWGFPVKCNFSFDGREIASGSSDGCIYFYDYKSSKFLRKVKAFGEACIDVAFHPLIPRVVASCSWNGEVSVFE